ncbi:PTS sugar transporter subunit IIA [[Collinsella] massiliensis]|uniref:PTS EIIA type-2 domain-containing protein n=1 Tax=[Collinsella] massiliensis TaxID=1232426 RepID=A0A1Y3XW74_9ACTN|nr:PTS sugar transporter subunit IIA [[Collinsella] massiliensis]OUN88548.1 hypothetical protein B5G02_05690 [[Collinsella] massiliensis]
MNSAKQPIHKLLTPKAVALGANARDAEEAIHLAGELLVASGNAEEAYVEAMVDAYHSLGPYMVIAPGLAMPHARPSGFVAHPCISLLTLANPVAFGHPTNDPVSVVIALGGTTNEGHLELLQALSSIFVIPDLVRRLHDAQSYEDVLEILKEGE